MKPAKVHFSYNLSRGSHIERQAMARNMSEGFFTNIVNFYKNKSSVPIGTVEKQLKEFMPETIWFSIKKLNKEQAKYCGGEMCSKYIYNQLVGYNIYIPAKNKNLHIYSIPAMMHEVTHLFDSAISPKYEQNYSTLCLKNLDKKTTGLYESYFYSGNRTKKTNKIKDTYIAKKQTEKSLCNMSNFDKITILNYIKYNLEQEINAFKMEEKCGKNLNLTGKCHYNSLNDMEGLYHLSSKLGMINKMLYKTITQARCIMAIQNAATHIDKLKLILSYCLKNII